MQESENYGGFSTQTVQVAHQVSEWHRTHDLQYRSICTRGSWYVINHQHHAGDQFNRKEEYGHESKPECVGEDSTSLLVIAGTNVE